MKRRTEKIQVAVYGKRNTFRFHFIMKYPISYDTEKDIKRMIRIGRREALQIFKDSKPIYKRQYGGVLEKISWL